MSKVTSSSNNSFKKLVTGTIRINQKRYTDAFVDDPDEGPDIFITSRADALEGDLVEVAIHEPNEWKLKLDIIITKWETWRKQLLAVIDKLPDDNDQCLKETSSQGSNVTNSQQSNDNSNSNNTNSFKLPSNFPPKLLSLRSSDVLHLPFAQNFLQKTGSVTKVIKRNNSGIAGGYLKPHSDLWALFSPIDSRKPRMLISIGECPLDFRSNAHRYNQILFIARIITWDPTKKFAMGQLMKIVGDGNQIQSRIESILLENQIVDQDFPLEVYQELEYLKNLSQNWFLEQMNNRRDLTNECTITIDPKTARDLDDAVSLKRLGDNILEVGVHIADVSYFVKELSAVDYHARQRTTSVYLVDRVIPMLPRILCENMCSLNPGELKLAFSVIWKISKDGKIIDEWIGRTVIRTCCKLAYEQAQDIISREGDISWIQDGINMPKLYGNFNWSQISMAIVSLNTLANLFRKRRFSNGALRIEQVKLKYELDSDSGMPTGFSFEDRSDANYLIEEFMLLANMSVAKRIHKFAPDMAFLRRHPPSAPSALKEVKEFCDAKGYVLDVSSSLGIQTSLNRIPDPSISKVVSHLLLRTMKNAEYICAGQYPNQESEYHHFALNAPYYTHFTSPIRRYADIVVHRQLSLNMGYERCSNEDVNSLTMIAGECTKRKISSKVISDFSQKLYFNLFVLKAGYCELLACVTKIYDRSFDVILVNYDRVGRVYLDNIGKELSSYKFESNQGMRSLELTWAKGLKTNTEPVKLSKKKQKKEKKEMISRGELESERIKYGGVGNVNKSGRQLIQVFDMIKVIVTTNPKDITQLNINLGRSTH